ncbi:MAG: hypothetical protein LQ346_008417 [Caloplaca aetnensis]|nr:MAG: hypothetical protein LQ346_008417 [Caloplaca aetnensis]
MQFPTLLLLSTIFSITSSPWTTTAAPVRDSTDDATTLAAINQLLSLFSQSLDEKNLAALGDVYTADASIGGGGAPPLTGLPAIIEFYTATFQDASLKTLHTSDTVLGGNFTETTATSVSYANVYYFGPEVFERGGESFSNSSVIFRERLENEYQRDANGIWKITRQTGPFILSIEGDTSILRPI